MDVNITLTDSQHKLLRHLANKEHLRRLRVQRKRMVQGHARGYTGWEDKVDEARALCRKLGLHREP